MQQAQELVSRLRGEIAEAEARLPDRGHPPANRNCCCPEDSSLHGSPRFIFGWIITLRQPGGPAV